MAGTDNDTWDLADVPEQDRFDLWTEVLGRTYIPFSTEVPDRSAAAFSAVVREQRLGEMRLVDTLAQPHRARRALRQVSATTRDVVGLQYVADGKEVVRHGDDVLVLGPGDMMLWDSGVRCSYEVVETLHKRTLILARSVAVSLLPSIHSPMAVRAMSGPEIAPVRSLFELLGVLSDALATMSPEATKRAAALVVQMLADLDPRARTCQHASGTRAARERRARVLGYIEDNLGDLTLSPATIAAAQFVSIRTLYAAFDDLNTTLAAHIRARRLAHCYADLANTDDHVGDIASRWGFINPAHFSRVFHKHYGFPPSRARDHSLAGPR
jgi:AraC-like DNA-binding protein